MEEMEDMNPDCVSDYDPRRLDVCQCGRLNVDCPCAQWECRSHQFTGEMRERACHYASDECMCYEWCNVKMDLHVHGDGSCAHVEEEEQEEEGGERKRAT